MSIIHHPYTTIRALLSMDDTTLERFMRSCTRKCGATIRRRLLRAQEDGDKIWPLCVREDCPDFDYTGGGCPGHGMEAKED